jgi:glycosyltransferase involved in cell wall biosynthesis
MRCCEIVPSLEEKHGGPSKSVLSLSRALGVNGASVSLFATHPTTKETRSEPGLSINIFRRGRPDSFCPSSELRTALKLSAFDVVHHHSLWLRTLHYANGYAKGAGVPLVISPRGMMSEWAWNYHGWKKRFARQFIHPGAFKNAAGWHATSAEEAAEIRTHGFHQPICVAPNGVSKPSQAHTDAARAYWEVACPDTTRRPTALFYSRFHRKKRVLELIDLWLARAPDDWLLLMVGLPGDYTAHQLEAYVLRASGGNRIRIYDGEGLPPPYPVASLFVLPSHTENFGLVIAEAMAYGLPAVVTDSTPWSAVNTASIGWCVPWEQYSESLKSALSESPDQLKERGARASRWVLENYSWDQSARTLADFYQQLSKGGRPQ